MKYLKHYSTVDDFESKEDEGRGIVIDSEIPGCGVIDENTDLVHYNQFGPFLTVKPLSASSQTTLYYVDYGENYEYIYDESEGVFRSTEDFGDGSVRIHEILPCYTPEIMQTIIDLNNQPSEGGDVAPEEE